MDDASCHVPGLWFLGCHNQASVYVCKLPQHAPDCGQSLTEKNLLGRGWFVRDRPSRIACPHILKVGICLTSLPGAWSYEDEVFPEIGDELQARLELRGKIVIQYAHNTRVRLVQENTFTSHWLHRYRIRCFHLNHRSQRWPGRGRAKHRGVKDLQLTFLRVKKVD